MIPGDPHREDGRLCGDPRVEVLISEAGLRHVQRRVEQLESGCRCERDDIESRDCLGDHERSLG